MHRYLILTTTFDSVQLRPTVRPMGKALEFDKSLFERLYTGPDFANLSKTMLEVWLLCTLIYRLAYTDVT